VLATGSKVARPIHYQIQLPLCKLRVFTHASTE